MSKELEEVDKLRKFLSDTIKKGPQEFSIPEPEEAFETWWRKTYNLDSKTKKAIAKNAWYAALKELGC
jgi:hypothetical protein